MLGNDFGNMKDSLRRVAEYQRIRCKVEPGFGENYYLLAVEEDGVNASDVFHITHDGHLNRAINTLLGRLYAAA